MPAARRGLSLVASYMDTDFAVVDAKASLFTAAGLMSDKGVDLLLVLGEKSAPAGLVSARDMVRVASRGEDLARIPVGDAMTVPVPTLRPDTPLMLALELSREGQHPGWAVVDSEGGAVGILAVADLLRAVAGEVQDLNRELLRLDELKSDFVKSVSHELRTPLAAIDGSVSNILDGIYGPPPEGLMRYLEMIDRNAKRLGKVIGDLLTISELEAGRYAPAKEPVPLDRAVQDVLDSFGEMAARRGVRLGKRVPEGATIQADSAMINLLLSHLVLNGIKFTSEGGLVEVVVEDRGEYVRGCVRDTGMGIRTEDFESIFDKFHQVGREDGPGERGTGLGLSICKHVVEKHQGRIWVESQPGKGSEFFFILPKES